MAQPSGTITSCSYWKQRTHRPISYNCLETKNHRIIRRNLSKSHCSPLLQLKAGLTRSGSSRTCPVKFWMPKEGHSIASPGNCFQCLTTLVFKTLFSIFHLVSIASHIITGGLQEESSLWIPILAVQGNSTISSLSSFLSDSPHVSHSPAPSSPSARFAPLSVSVSYCKAKTQAQYSRCGLTQALTRGEESIPSACWLHPC